MPSKKTHVVQDGQNNGGSKQLTNSQRASLKIRDYYEEWETLVEQIYTNVPGSREKTQVKYSHLSYARKMDGFDENHHRQHLSKAVVFQDPILESVPFRARVRQQDFVDGSKKRKNRQSRPQGVREDDPTQLVGNEKEPAHYEDNQTEKLCKNRIHQQANLSSPLITTKGSPELRDPNFRVTTSPCEDASNTSPCTSWMVGKV